MELQALRQLREVIEDGSLVFFFFSDHCAKLSMKVSTTFCLWGWKAWHPCEDYADPAVSLDLIVNKLRKGTGRLLSRRKGFPFTTHQASERSVSLAKQNKDGSNDKSKNHFRRWMPLSVHTLGAGTPKHSDEVKRRGVCECDGCRILPNFSSRARRSYLFIMNR